MKKYDYRKISTIFSYAIPDLARLFGVSERTIHNWIGSGLTPIEFKKSPLLFQGETIKNFLKQIKKAKQTTMKKHESYCFKCRCPRPSKEKSISISRNTRYSKCEVCNGNMARFLKPP
jgi:hypothetical protein